MKADLHIHSDRSFDGCLTPSEIKSLCLSRGITAAAVCDHNVSPDLSLAEDGFLWVPAIEYSTNHGHLIGLFLQHPVLVDPPYTDFVTAAEQIHFAGGITVLAHPFERAADPEQRWAEIETLLPYLDGLEVQNSRAGYKYKNANDLARQFAERHNIRCITAGSDAHLAKEIGLSYTELPECDSLEALLKALTDGATAKGTNGKRRWIAQSQLRKAKRKRFGFKSRCKTALLWCYLAGKDLFLK